MFDLTNTNPASAFVIAVDAAQEASARAHGAYSSTQPDHTAHRRASHETLARLGSGIAGCFNRIKTSHFKAWVSQVLHPAETA